MSYNKELIRIYLTDLEQLLSAAKVPVQMQEKTVAVLSFCLTGSQDWMGEYNGGTQSFNNSEIIL